MNSNGKLYYRLVIPPSAPTAARNNESPTPLGNSTKSPLMCGNRDPAWRSQQSLNAAQRNEIPRTPLVKSPLICAKPNPPAWRFPRRNNSITGNFAKHPRCAPTVIHELY